MTLFKQAPIATRVVAVLTLIAMAAVLLYAVLKWLRWRREILALRAVGAALLTQEDQKDLRDKRHAELYEHGDDVIVRIKEVAHATSGASDALPLIDTLGAQVKPSHDPSVIGAGSSWPEVLRRFLGRRRWPLRLMRAAAGWVVLLGLAGTVLGFVEALPKMREAFVSAAQAEAAASRVQTRSEATTAPPTGQRGISAAGEMIGVLGDLGGVFLATLTGVFSALVLYTASAGFERTFEALAQEIEIFGRHWFLPLAQPPYTQLDQAVKNGLGDYFQDLSGQVSKLIQPVVDRLAGTLDDVDKTSQQFSSNIEASRDTLKTFHGAVATLGSSAEEAVKHLSQIIEPSQRFLEDIQQLQREGEKSFAEAVGRMETPLSELATSAKSIETGVQKMEGFATSLDSSVGRLEETLESHGEGVEGLRKELENLSAAYSEHERSVASLAEAVSNAAAARPQLEVSLTEIQEQLPQIRSHLVDLGSSLRLEAPLPKTVIDLLTHLKQDLGTRTDRLSDTLAELGDRLASTLEHLQEGLTESRAQAESDLRQLVSEVTSALEMNGDHPAPSFDAVREELAALRKRLESGEARVRLDGLEGFESGVEELRTAVKQLEVVAKDLRPQVLLRTKPTASKGKKGAGPPSPSVSESLMAEQIRVLQRMESLATVTSEALARLEHRVAQQDQVLGADGVKQRRHRRLFPAWLRNPFRRSELSSLVESGEDSG